MATGARKCPSIVYEPDVRSQEFVSCEPSHKRTSQGSACEEEKPKNGQKAAILTAGAATTIKSTPNKNESEKNGRMRAGLLRRAAEASASLNVVCHFGVMRWSATSAGAALNVGSAPREQSRGAERPFGPATFGPAEQNDLCLQGVICSEGSEWAGVCLQGVVQVLGGLYQCAANLARGRNSESMVPGAPGRQGGAKNNGKQRCEDGCDGKQG